MRITVPYGNAEKNFEIPEGNLLRLVTHDVPRSVRVEDERRVVENALRNPVGTKLIAEMVRAEDKVVVITDDWTRPTPTYRVAPVLLEELQRAGITDENVSFIVARGTHRRLSARELRRKLGGDIVSRFKSRNHETDRDLVYLGISRRGTPVWVSRAAVEADRRIAIGSIVAHPLAGYGGGAKIILPGISGFETISHNHGMVDEPNVKVGITDGNPVREDMEETGRIARLDFILNVVLNDRKEIVAAAAGDMVEAHREAVRHYDRLYGTTAIEDADIVVLGSCPRDATFGHATFSLYAATLMLKPGGTIILVAPCEDGPGTRMSRLGFKQLASLKPKELMALIKAGQVDASSGAFDYCYAKVASRNGIVLVSDNFSRREAEELGVGYGVSVQEALDDAIRSEGTDAKVTVLPTGGLTVPRSSLPRR